MTEKDLAQAIVDWFMGHDCTETQALRAVIKIIKEANHGTDSK